MKKIINNKRYDTNTARLVGEWQSSDPRSDFRYYSEALYVKRTGEYFLAGHGNAASPYSRKCGQHEWCSGEQITPFTPEQAREWGEDKMESDAYEAEFKVEAEPSDNRIGAAIKAARGSKGLTQSALAEAIGTDQRQIWRWESGERYPSGYQVMALAAALGIDPGALLK